MYKIIQQIESVWYGIIGFEIVVYVIIMLSLDDFLQLFKLYIMINQKQNMMQFLKFECDEKKIVLNYLGLFKIQMCFDGSELMLVVEVKFCRLLLEKKCF